MGDEDTQQQPDPPRPDPTDASSHADRMGSEEAGLHETSGSAISMPEWADSLSHGSGRVQPKVRVDLAERLKQEEAERVARQKAEEEQARKAAEEELRRAEQERREAATAPPSGRRRVSRWPSMLAAGLVILLGAIIGIKTLGSGVEPEAAATPFPVVSGAPQTGPVETSDISTHLKTYTVKPGDTLESIAVRFSQTPVEISRVNGAYGGRLIRVEPGQVINIP